MTTPETILDFVQETRDLTTEEAFLAEHPYPFLLQEDTGQSLPSRDDRRTTRLRGSAIVPKGEGFLQGDVTIYRIYPRQEPDQASDEPPAVTIGRDEGCDLIVEDGSISAVHAAFGIAYDDDGERCFTVTDCGSSNGTFLNGDRLEARAPTNLDDNDSLRLGPAVKFQFFTAAQFFQFLSLYRRMKK